MDTAEIVSMVVIFAFSLAFVVLSFFHFKEKGYLFNNAYLYASKEQKKTMNKKPFYRQSAICFLGFGIILALLGVNVLLNSGVLDVFIGVITLLVLVYAIASSIKMA